MSPPHALWSEVGGCDIPMRGVFPVSTRLASNPTSWPFSSGTEARVPSLPWRQDLFSEGGSARRSGCTSQSSDGRDLAASSIAAACMLLLAPCTQDLRRPRPHCTSTAGSDAHQRCHPDALYQSGVRYGVPIMWPKRYDKAPNTEYTCKPSDDRQSDTHGWHSIQPKPSHALILLLVFFPNDCAYALLSFDLLVTSCHQVRAASFEAV